jgi:hypothetical protein
VLTPLTFQVVKRGEVPGLEVITLAVAVLLCIAPRPGVIELVAAGWVAFGSLVLFASWITRTVSLVAILLTVLRWLNVGAV